MIPETREELKQYVLESLGEPVIKVNIASVQLDSAIEDALDYWSEFHINAQDHTYIKVPIEQEDIANGYVMLPDSVMSVLSIIDPSSVTGGRGFGTYEYEMTRDTVFSMTGSTGNCSTSIHGGQSDTPLGSYVVQRQYLETIAHTLKAPILYDYRYHKRRITIVGGIGRYYNPGDYMVLEVQGYLYKDSYNIWGDRALRNLATAYAKKTWGQNLKKFSGVQLPSGVNLNGDGIYSDALQDIEQAEQYIQGQSEPMGIHIG